MLFMELLTIGLRIGAIAFGGALLIIILLELLELIFGFFKYNKLQKKANELETQKNNDIDFEKLQNDLDHWTQILEQ